jgi:disulfide bond formation protein DsbB
MSLLGNIIIALVLAGLFLGGGALFFIAQQDDSRAGRLIGLLAATAGAVATIYLTAGHHWL